MMWWFSFSLLLILEDTVRVIKSRKSTTVKQHNDPRSKDKWPNNDLQSTIHKTENIRSNNANLTYNRGGGEGDLRCPERLYQFLLRTWHPSLLNDTNIFWYRNRVEHQYTKKHTNNINKTWTPYETFQDLNSSIINFF